MSDNSRPSDKQLEDGIVYTQKKALLDRLKNLESGLPEVDATPPWYLRKGWEQLGMAAAIAGLAIMAWLWIDHSTSNQVNKVIAEYFEPIPYPGGVDRSTPSENQGLEQRAVLAYEQQQYAEAIPLLQALIEEEQDSLAFLFLGIAQLGTGDAQSAINSITQFVDYDDSTYSDEAHYYLGLAHLQLGNLQQVEASADRIDRFSDWRAKLLTALGNSTSTSSQIITQDTIIRYFFGELIPGRRGSGLAETLTRGTENYYYFPSDSGSIKRQNYWYHIAELPVPDSFFFVGYTYDQSNNKFVIDTLIDIGPTYDGSVPFITNIREKEFERVLFKLDDANGLVAEETIANLSGPQIAWDYKQDNGVSVQACGSKCREVLFVNYTNSPQLVVLYSQQNRNSSNQRFYYIPCLGKTMCNTGTAADIVYYNADSTELVKEWLEPYAKGAASAPYELPGVGDNLDTYDTEVFGEGANRVTIKLTNNSNKFSLSGSCAPLRKTCQ